MSKNDSFFDEICNIILIYHFRWVILIGLIFFIIVGTIMFYDINKDLNKESIEKGYSGFLDDIKYDDWTGEMIPKAEIDTYNNDNKFIIVNEKKIYFYQIKQQINEYKKIQGQYMFIKEKDKKAIDKIGKKIFNEYLGVEYEWRKASNSQYEIHIKNYKYGAYIGATSVLKDFVAEKVKEIYKEQN